MQNALYALCVLLWIVGAVCLFLIGTNAVVQIIGCIHGLSGMVAFAGGAIVGAIDELGHKLKPKDQP
jgi:hypothetical protein